MYLDTVRGLISNFGGEDWTCMFVKNIPGIQQPILSGSKKNRWACRAPATICQIFSRDAGRLTYAFCPFYTYLHASYFVHMMELSLMSSDQILAHQALTVKKFWMFHFRKILLSKLTSNLWEAWISLES
jgi:hypothetical protein